MKQKETEREVDKGVEKEPKAPEKEPTDYEKHYAAHADPNRNTLNSFDPPPAERATKPPTEVGGGANLPKATGLDPNSCAIGDPDTTLEVTGMNFTEDTLIVFAGSPTVTEFISDTVLSCALSPGAFTEARGYPVTVQRGGYVNPVATMFTVYDLEAVIDERTTTPKNKKKGK